MSLSFGTQIALVIGAYAILMVVLWQIIQHKKKKREKKESEFVSTLVESIRNESINNNLDLNDLYLAFFKDKQVDTPSPHELAQLLRRVKLYFSTEKPLDKKSLEYTNELLVVVKEQEIEERAKAPFSGVPSPERSLLDDIREVSGAKTEPFIQDKLSELASAIKIRQDTIDKLGEENGRSLKWAKWGVFGTVAFSILSIVITYYYSSSGT
jgi:hypothetical protein